MSLYLKLKIPRPAFTSCATSHVLWFSSSERQVGSNLSFVFWTANVNLG